MRAPLYSFRSSTFDRHAYFREILVLPVLLRRGMGFSDTVATNEEYYGIYKSMISIIHHSEAFHPPLSVHEPIPARTLNLQILARICLLICDLYLDTLRARPNQGLFP